MLLSMLSLISICWRGLHIRCQQLFVPISFEVRVPKLDAKAKLLCRACRNRPTSSTTRAASSESFQGRGR